MIFRITLLLTAITTVLIAPPASAGLVLFTDPTAYAAQLSSLSYATTAVANFETTGDGPVGMSFSENGIDFSSLTSSMRISSGETSSPSFFLGYDDLLAPDFTGGDQVTVTLPSDSRAISLQIISDTIPDALAFASLTVDGQTINTIANGTFIAGSFQSYFLGIINDSGTIGSASVDFTGGSFFRVDDVSVAGLTAVPEPSSIALVSVIGLAAMVRRRARRS